MIEATQIQRLIASQAQTAVEASDEILSRFSQVTCNLDISIYLRECTPDELVQLGEIRLHPFDRIKAEIASGARPGSTVFRLGHLPIASTVGGQLICVSRDDGTIRWADGSYICDEYLCYFDGARLQELEVNHENLVRIMPEVAKDFRELFELVESGKANDRILSLDS